MFAMKVAMQCHANDSGNINDGTFSNRVEIATKNFTNRREKINKTRKREREKYEVKLEK